MVVKMDRTMAAEHDAELLQLAKAEAWREGFDAGVRANALLIAAAPELYQALSALGAVFLRRGSREEYDNTYRQAGIAALAKARGETP
jgi:Flp pilus assembly protein TadD